MDYVVVADFAVCPRFWRKQMKNYMKRLCFGIEQDGVIPCFETDGESMDVYIAVK